MVGYGFTPRTLVTLQLAREQAEREGAPAVDVDHLLLALTSPSHPMGIRLEPRIDFTALRESIWRPASTSLGKALSAPFTERLKSALNESIEQARALGHETTRAEHLFLAALNQVYVQQLFVAVGLDPEGVRSALVKCADSAE